MTGKVIKLSEQIGQDEEGNSGVKEVVEMKVGIPASGETPWTLKNKK